MNRSVSGAHIQDARQRDQEVLAERYVGDASFAGACTSAPRAASGPILSKKVSGQSRRRPIHDREFLNIYKTLAGDPSVRPGARERATRVIGHKIDPLPKGPLSSLYTAKPSPWEQIDEATQAHFAHQALADTSAEKATLAATAHPSEVVNAKAYAHPAGPLIFLRRRLAAALRREFGAPVRFYMTGEESMFGMTEEGGMFRLPGHARAMHVHAELGLDPANSAHRTKARAAIRRALGEWTGRRRRKQIVLKPVRTSGWASYCTKGCRMATPRMVAFLKSVGAGASMLPGHQGPTLTMDNATRAAAKLLHEKARQIVTEARQRPTALSPQPSSPESLLAAGDSSMRIARRASTHCRRTSLANRRLRPLLAWPTAGQCWFRLPLSLPVAPRRPVLHALPTSNRSRGPPGTKLKSLRSGTCGRNLIGPDHLMSGRSRTSR